MSESFLAEVLNIIEDAKDAPLARVECGHPGITTTVEVLRVGPFTHIGSPEGVQPFIDREGRKALIEALQATLDDPELP